MVISLPIVNEVDVGKPVPVDGLVQRSDKQASCKKETGRQGIEFGYQKIGDFAAPMPVGQQTNLQYD